MVRSIWKGAVVVMLAWGGVVWCQQIRPSAEQQAAMTVYENGKELQCRVILRWQTPAGHRAMQVQVIASGEMLTLEEDGPASTVQGRAGNMRALSMKIFHWGRLRTPPAGSPVPPSGEFVFELDQRPVNGMQKATAIPVTDTQKPTVIPASATMIDDCGCSSCESGEPARRLRSWWIFGKSRDSKTCDTCAPSVPSGTEQAGCGCGKPLYAQADTTMASASPYAPIVSGPGSDSAGTADNAPTSAKSKSQKVVAAPPSEKTEVATVPSPSGDATAKTLSTEGSAKPAPVPAAPDLPNVPLPSVAAPPVPGQPAVSAPGAPAPLQPGALPPLPGQPGPLPTQAVPAEPIPSQSGTSLLPLPASETASPKTIDPTKEKHDWHNMWGDTPYAKTRQPGQTLVDPTPTGKGPALPKDERSATGLASAKAAKTPAESARQSDPLLNPERYQPAVVERKMEKVGVYVPRPPQAGMPAGSPPLPLGSVSVLAAQNGMVKPVQFVPVPVSTVPQPWRPPQPPPPEMPNAPSPASYVNAFTAPKPQMPAQQPPAPSGAFTAPPNTGQGVPASYGPMPYGPMPYGPMPYGQGNDPRMMMAYGPMAPQGMYQQAPYMNQPPSLTNSLPAYAYQQMAQGMLPQRPLVQVNYPASYAGPMPPSPFAVQPMRPYGPPMPVYANPAMDRPGVPTPPPPGNIVAASFYPSKTVYTLRESLYPAERETAAITLGNQDLRAQPDAVQALLAAARQDPAGTVRAACVHCLARQQLYGEQVVNTLNDLKNDQDPRVRQEVDQALAQMRR